MDASGVGFAATVITVSDRCSRGEREDTSGPLLDEALVAMGATVSRSLVPDGDASVAAALRDAVAAGAQVVVTTGGTGVSPRDRTPEGTAAVLAQHLPGLAEAIRSADAGSVPTAVLSRGLAGLTDEPERALIVNLPGSEGGSRTGMTVLATVLPHLLAQVAGGDHA